MRFRKSSFARRGGGPSCELVGAVSSGDAARFGAPGQPLSHLACSIDGVRHHPGNGRIHLVAAQRSALGERPVDLPSRARTRLAGKRRGPSGRCILKLLFLRRLSYFSRVV